MNSLDLTDDFLGLDQEAFDDFLRRRGLSTSRARRRPTSRQTRGTAGKPRTSRTSTASRRRRTTTQASRPGTRRRSGNPRSRSRTTPSRTRGTSRPSLGDRLRPGTNRMAPPRSGSGTGPKKAPPAEASRPQRAGLTNRGRTRRVPREGGLLSRITERQQERREQRQNPPSGTARANQEKKGVPAPPDLHGDTGRLFTPREGGLIDRIRERREAREASQPESPPKRPDRPTTRPAAPQPHERSSPGKASTYPSRTGGSRPQSRSEPSPPKKSGQKGQKQPASSSGIRAGSKPQASVVTSGPSAAPRKGVTESPPEAAIAVVAPVMDAGNPSEASSDAPTTKRNAGVAWAVGAGVLVLLFVGGRYLMQQRNVPSTLVVE